MAQKVLMAIAATFALVKKKVSEIAIETFVLNKT